MATSPEGSEPPSSIDSAPAHTGEASDTSARDAGHPTGEGRGNRDEGDPPAPVPKDARARAAGQEGSSQPNEAAQASQDGTRDERPLPPPAPVAAPLGAPASTPAPPPPPPPPDHDAVPAIKLKPRRPRPPEKGILKPPSTAPANSARFSFRRDILQPLQYSRLAGGVVPVSSGLPSTVAVGEAMGNAAATAGTWMGSALKRLGQAAGVAVEGQGPGLGQPPAPSGGTRMVANGSTGPSPAAAVAATEVGERPSQPPLATAVAHSNHTASQALPPPPPPPPPPPSLSVSSLKQVRFRMQSLAVVYPINGASSSSFASSASSASAPDSASSRPPSTSNHTTFFNDLKVGFHPGPPLAPVEESETRKRVEREWRHRIRMRSRASTDRDGSHAGADKAPKARGKERDPGTSGWTGAELERLYRECCKSREEPGIERLKRLLREAPASPPKSIDLSRELLSHGAVEALSDLLSVDFGLKKLVLDGCGLDDESVKPLLHALLVSGSVPTVSLANNKRIRQKGWKYVAIFVKKAKFLRYLDLSENNVDRKAAEWMVQSLVPSPPLASTSSSSNRSDESGATLIDFDSPRPSNGDLNGGSRNNGRDPASNGSQAGSADAREEEQGAEEDRREMEPLFEVAPLLREEKDGPAGSVLSLRLENCGLRGQGLEILAQGVRISSLKHISLRRNRINTASAVSLAVMIRDFPLSTELPASQPLSSSRSTSPMRGSLLDSPPVHRQSNPFEGGNSVSVRQGFTRTDHQARYSSRGGERGGEEGVASANVAFAAAQAERDALKADELRVRLRRQIDALPRVGSLLTLDVKGNDIRGGVTYIAQVLKRNRTLKVLNLSENKIDTSGLVAIAEALRYNTTLETLDMSLNPCCGPSIEGVLTLRSSMMVTPALKRLFLNSTDLTSEGAIAMAEFLPEARSLLHLDLTSNQVDISGVLALAVSVKLNSTIRCLDLNIPPNDPDFSRLSQDILETCVRNTEIAQLEADGKGKKVTIAQPIMKSALAVNLEERQKADELESQKRKERRVQGKTIFAAAEETRDVVKELLAVDQQAASKGVIVAPSEVVRDALVQLQLAEAQLAEAFTATRQGETRERAELLLTELASLLDLARELYDRPSESNTPLDSSRSSTNGTRRDLARPATLEIPGPPANASEQPSSPSFSLTSSDSEESADEQERDLDNGTVTLSSSPAPGPSATELLGADRSTSENGVAASPSTSASPPLASPPSSPHRRSPIESSSRSMTLEEGEIFRKGLALGTSQVPDDDDDDEVSARAGGPRSMNLSEADQSDGSTTGAKGLGLGLGLGLGEFSGEELKNELLEAKVPRSPRTSFTSSTVAPLSELRREAQASSPTVLERDDDGSDDQSRREEGTKDEVRAGE
ncbi:hypothetical protein JCM10212_002877 [Sporobolomyces blumeae]